MGAACHCCLQKAWPRPAANSELSPVPSWGGDKNRGDPQKGGNQLLVQPHAATVQGWSCRPCVLPRGGQKDLEPGLS